MTWGKKHEERVKMKIEQEEKRRLKERAERALQVVVALELEAKSFTQPKRYNRGK